MSDLEAHVSKECGWAELHALSSGIRIRMAWVWIPAIAPDHLVALASYSTILNLSFLICKIQAEKFTFWVLRRIK